MSRKRNDNSSEVLRKPINPSGAGEDPVIKDLLGGEMAGATDTEALNMALALQQIARGQASILEMVKENTEQGRKMQEELRILKKEAAERDAAADRFREDQEKFLADIRNQAEKLRVTGIEKDKMIAQAAQLTAVEIQKAKISMKEDARRFDEELAHMPTVTVRAPGEIVTTHQNGVPSARLMPTVIRIKHRQWVLPPGRAVEVPRIVADALEHKLDGMTQDDELKDALSGNLEAHDLQKKMIAMKKKEEAPYDPTAVDISVVDPNREPPKL